MSEVMDNPIEPIVAPDPSSSDYERRSTVMDMARIGCSDKDICIRMGCDREALLRRYGKELELGHVAHREDILRGQHEVATSDRADKGMMLRFLGKNYCEQSDKVEQTGQGAQILVVMGNAPRPSWETALTPARIQEALPEADNDAIDAED